MTTALSQLALQRFVDDFLRSKLVARLRSAPVPASQSGAVYELVASTLDAYIKNPKADVLVYFYGVRACCVRACVRASR